MPDIPQQTSINYINPFFHPINKYIILINLTQDTKSFYICIH
jgi:hypothetical protein